MAKHHEEEVAAATEIPVGSVELEASAITVETNEDGSNHATSTTNNAIASESLVKLTVLYSSSVSPERQDSSIETVVDNEEYNSTESSLYIRKNVTAVVDVGGVAAVVDVDDEVKHVETASIPATTNAANIVRATRINSISDVIIPVNDRNDGSSSEEDDADDVAADSKRKSKEGEQQQVNEAEIALYQSGIPSNNTGDVEDHSDANLEQSDDIEEQNEEEEELSTRTPNRKEQDNTSHQRQATDDVGENSGGNTATIDDQEEKDEEPMLPLYKSSRLKGYITLTLAGFLNYDAAYKSDRSWTVMSSSYYDNTNSVSVSSDSSFDSTGITESVDSSANTFTRYLNTSGEDMIISDLLLSQRQYAQAVGLITVILAGMCWLLHLDRFTRLETLVWYRIFKNGSKIECCMIVFLCVWWCIATFVNTSVTGLAGDGKITQNQCNLYYSTWVCCITCFWMLERWITASTNWPSVRVFIASWPNRAPVWICILVLSCFTLLWYINLWQSHSKLGENATHILEYNLILLHFESVSEGQWQWLIIVTVCTILPSLVFVLAELFRGTQPDGSSTPKGRTEIYIEGLCFVTMMIAWIPTVIIVTAPKGAASLAGNAYFFTWGLTLFISEGLLWYVHDQRTAARELWNYQQKLYAHQQLMVLQRTVRLQQQYSSRSNFQSVASAQQQNRQSSNSISHDY